MGEFGILDRVLTDAENAIYDAGMAAAYARAAEVAQHRVDMIGALAPAAQAAVLIALPDAILALGEAK